MKVESVLDGRVVHCTFDDLLHHDLDEKGYLTLWDLSKVFMEARVTGWLIHDQHGLATAYQGDHSLFIRTQRIQINPSFYSKLSPKQPVVCTVRVLHVGRTSLVLIHELMVKKTGEMLATSLVQYVFVSRINRRSMPLPESYVRVHDDLTKVPRPKLLEDFPGIPTNSRNLYQYTVIVPEGDIDMNKHTNQSNYIKYCLECARCGARDRAYSILRKDPLEYQIRDVSLQYISESVIGDRLSVNSWENETQPNLVYFTIRKEEREILNCSMTFSLSSFPAKM